MDMSSCCRQQRKDKSLGNGYRIKGNDLYHLLINVSCHRRRVGEGDGTCIKTSRNARVNCQVLGECCRLSTASSKGQFLDHLDMDLSSPTLVQVCSNCRMRQRASIVLCECARTRSIQGRRHKHRRLPRVNDGDRVLLRVRTRDRLFDPRRPFFHVIQFGRIIHRPKVRHVLPPSTRVSYTHSHPQPGTARGLSPGGRLSGRIGSTCRCQRCRFGSGRGRCCRSC